MQIRIMSDLHLEFHRDGGFEFIDRLQVDSDVLVLAGDICEGTRTTEVLSRFCAKFPQIVYVNGNHELYGISREIFAECIAEASAANPNLHHLDNRVVEIGGRRFVGSTLWFVGDELSKAYEGSISDFSKIQDARYWVYSYGAQCKNWLMDTVQPTDIVVTHHLPSEACVNKWYKNSPMNRFFVNEMGDWITESGPELWIHGHTHSRVDTVLGNTRIVCNPAGYEFEGALGFDENFAVNLQESEKK